MFSLSFIPPTTDDTAIVNVVIKKCSLRMFFLLSRRRRLAGRTSRLLELILKSVYLAYFSPKISDLSVIAGVTCELLWTSTGRPKATFLIT